MQRLIFTIIWIFSFAATNAQNVGIGVTNPLQKLHVGGNMRIDGMAIPGTGIITTNSNGDLLRTNFSGNANDVLRGNGTFGIVPNGLPSGAIIVSSNPNDANLVAAGFSFYGELPVSTTKYQSYAGGVSTQFGLMKAAMLQKHPLLQVELTPRPCGQVRKQLFGADMMFQATILFFSIQVQNIILLRIRGLLCLP
jgi:hypothetical protein